MDDGLHVLDKSTGKAHVVPSKLPSLSAAPQLPSETYAAVDSLMKASENERMLPGDHFAILADRECILPKTWEQEAILSDLQSLTQKSPAFLPWHHDDIKTHACLHITNQPGPVFIATAHAPIGSFRIQLLPHPLMPLHATKTWRVSSLRVTLLNDCEGEKAGTTTKKRKRGNKYSKRKSSTVTLNREYPFDKMDTCIADMVLPPSACRPVRLEFSCTVVDPLNRIAVLTATSRSFIVVSNCNQWSDGLGVCLRNLIFRNGEEQAPFARLFNYLQLLYLDFKGFYEIRYLEPDEIFHWLRDCADHDNRIMARDYKLLDTHQTVTLDLFESWFEVASSVLYDLHTSNVGKLFQKLWASGFVRIGKTRDRLTKLDMTPGYHRLAINTNPAEMFVRESYLVLQSIGRNYSLLALERDHLDYFFEHSRNSFGCTHLISAIDDQLTLPVESIYASKLVSPSNMDALSFVYQIAPK